MRNILKMILDKLDENQQTREYMCHKNKSDTIPVDHIVPGATHIKNLQGYYTLSEQNSKRWRKFNRMLHRRYGRYFNEELLKEIAMDQLYTKYTLNELDELISDFEGVEKVEF